MIKIGNVNNLRVLDSIFIQTDNLSQKKGQSTAWLSLMKRTFDELGVPWEDECCDTSGGGSGEVLAKRVGPFEIAVGTNELNVSTSDNFVPDNVVFSTVDGTKTYFNQPLFQAYVDSADSPTTKLFVESGDTYSNIYITLYKIT